MITTDKKEDSVCTMSREVVAEGKVLWERKEEQKIVALFTIIYSTQGVISDHNMFLAGVEDESASPVHSLQTVSGTTFCSHEGGVHRPRSTQELGIMSSGWCYLDNTLRSTT